MPFSTSNTRRFRKNNPHLFDQIKASFAKIIQIDPSDVSDGEWEFAAPYLTLLPGAAIDTRKW